MVALGIDIGTSGVRFLTSGGRMWSWGLPADHGEALGALEQAFDAVAQTAKGCQSITVVCGGHVTAAGRIEWWPNRAAWAGLDLAKLIADAFSVAPAFEDDCAAAALAEAQRRPADPLVYVGLGTGVGGGLVAGGRVFRGAGGRAMEIGHVRVGAGKAQCRCGTPGCLQTVAGGEAILRELLKHGCNDGLVGLERGLSESEPWALTLAECVGDAICEAMLIVVRLLDPACIVIGGGVPEAAPGLRKLIIEKVGSIVAAQAAVWGKDSSVRGALLMAEDRSRGSRSS